MSLSRPQHRRRFLLGSLALPLTAGLAHRPAFAEAGGTIVYDGPQLRAALQAAAPGDTIVLAPGTYADNGDLLLAADGVTLRGPAGLGAVLRSDLSVRGQGCSVDGLAFDGASVTLSGSGSSLTRCRLTGCTSNAVTLAGGKGLRVGYCELAGFHGRGIVVRRETSAPRVDHNYIHDPVGGGPESGHEGIQVGRSMNDSDTRIGTVVEYNLLERMNAEQEAISVKSSGNTLRFNTLRDSRSFVSNRHGEDNVYAGNTLERTYGFVVQDRGTRLLGNVCVELLDRRVARIMGGDVPSSSTRQGSWPQAVDTLLCGNRFDALLVGAMWKGFDYPAAGTSISRHTGAVKLGAQVGTSLDGPVVDTPDAVSLAPGDVGPGATTPNAGLNQTA